MTLDWNCDKTAGLYEFTAEESYLSSAVFLYNKFNLGNAEMYIFAGEENHVLSNKLQLTGG